VAFTNGEKRGQLTYNRVFVQVDRMRKHSGLREIDDFHAYGTVMKLTTVDGRKPDAQRWLPGVVSARRNIRVRSTTARMLWFVISFGAASLPTPF